MLRIQPGSRIGIDLDNTLIDYSESLPKILRKFGLDPQLSRNEVRAMLQNKNGTDLLWQEIQASLYTTGLENAQIADGSIKFVKNLQLRKCEIFIISHKTKTTQVRFGGIDLHQLAFDWLKNSKLPLDFVINTNLFFSETLALKVKKIKSLELFLFVDDLIEVIEHLDFPKETIGWHYRSGSVDQHKLEFAGDFNDLLRRLEE